MASTFRFLTLSTDSEPVATGTLELLDLADIRAVTYGRQGAVDDLFVLTLYLTTGATFRVRYLDPSGNKGFLELWGGGQGPQ